MKRKASKFLAYLLIMVMALSSSVTVLAEENATISGNEVIVVEDVQNVTVSDNEVADEEVADEAVVEDELVDETVAEDEAVTEGEVVAEDETVTDNETVSGNETVSDNESVDAEEFVFPGLPDGYELSALELDKKESLGTTIEEMGELREGEDYVAGEVLFLCDTLEEAQLYASAYGAELKSFADGVAVITLPEAVNVMTAIQAAADERTMLPAVSPNYYRYPFETDEEIMDETNYAVSAAAFNDPMLVASDSRYQWHHQVVGSTYAWSNGYTGKGIKVAVIDSGVSTHEDLTIAGSYNAMAGSTSGTGDSDSHGTHVSGIIAAKNNNGKGGSGIAPNVALYNIKVFGNATDEAKGVSGTSETLIRAINKAISYDVDIINMSLGGMGRSVDEQTVITKAKNQGIAVFVAAGNDSSMTKMYPAGYEGSIAVAATDTNNARAYFSNYGSWIALSAPGVNIYSTVPGGYGLMSGTSQATPVVSGTAAVILSSNHTGLYDKNGKALTGAAKVDALVKIMQSNTVKVSGSKMGKGITNLPKVLKLSTIAGTPNNPEFRLMDGTVSKGGTFKTANLNIQIKAEAGMTIYYTTDGKTPAYKNGVATVGEKYTGGAIVLSGEVNGKVTGKMTVKAIAVNAAGKVSKVTSATFTFKPLVTAVTITGLNQVVAGKSITLKAAVTPTWAANKKVTWSISGDPKTTGVSINASSGKVTTKSTAKTGTYTVTATSKDGNAKKTFNITVLAAPKVDSMAFSQKNVDFGKNKNTTTHNLSTYLTVKDANGTVLKNNGNVNWSSSKDSIATVNANGVLTAKTAGKVTITATAADGSGKTAKITVNIVQLAETITIEGSKTVAKGKTVTLKATVGPTTTKDKTVTWKINSDASKGVTIDAKSGKVKATATAKAGTYTVTATASNGVQATKTITVIEQPLKSIKFSQKDVTLFRVSGREGAATSATIPLEVGEGYNKDSITVTSSAPGVVTATLSGQNVIVKATGVATGKATITVKATDGSNKSAKVTVKVINPASNLTLSPAAGRSESLAKGKSLKLSAVFESEYGALDSASKKVQWISSDESIATVSSSGVVTAKSGYDFKNGFYGEVTIAAMATDGSGLYAMYTIYTQEQIKSLGVADYMYGRYGWGYYYPVKSVNISISQDGYGIYPIAVNNEESWFDAGIYPELNLEVDKPDIATVDTIIESDGTVYLVVYPYKAGKVKVKLKPIDGSSASTSVTVNITN